MDNFSLDFDLNLIGSGIAAALLGGKEMSSRALSAIGGAIGGAIDRATLALLWLGRGVFVLTTLAALYCAGAAALTWWTMPQEWPATFAPIVHDSFAEGIKAGRHFKTGSDDIPTMKLKQVADPQLEAAAQRKWEVVTPDGKRHLVALPASASAADVAEYADQNLRRIFPVVLPDKRVLDVETYNEAAARTGAREWWEERIKTSRTYIWGSLGGAIAYFIAGAIFLGLTRVTRWIVTGR